MPLLSLLNVGTTADDNTGDTARGGGQKINDNFNILNQQTLTDASSVVWNVALGHRGFVTLTAARNMTAVTNCSNGQHIILVVKTDGTSRVLTFDAAYKDTDGTTNLAAQTIPASGLKIYQFIHDAGVFYRF